MIKNDTPHITILKHEYKRLLKASKRLEALEGAGVDNWDGYQYALDSIKELDEQRT